MKAILVDDDIGFCEMFLVRLREEAGKQDIVLECDVCHESKKVLQQNVVYDIYFLDIEMEGMSGLELAGELRGRYVHAEIIFISFHEQYVWQTFPAKPGAFIRKAQLDTDLPKALQIIAKRNRENSVEVEIPVNSRASDKIRPMDILYCKSAEHYVDFVWENGSHKLYRMKLNQAEELLQAYHFVRTHSRYLVNLEYICGLSADRVILINQEEIPVSRTYKRKVHMTVMNLDGQKRVAQ